MSTLRHLWTRGKKPDHADHSLPVDRNEIRTPAAVEKIKPKKWERRIEELKLKTPAEFLDYLERKNAKHNGRIKPHKQIKMLRAAERYFDLRQHDISALTALRESLKTYEKEERDTLRSLDRAIQNQAPGTEIFYQTPEYQHHLNNLYDICDEAIARKNFDHALRVLQEAYQIEQTTSLATASILSFNTLLRLTRIYENEGKDIMTLACYRKMNEAFPLSAYFNRSLQQRINDLTAKKTVEIPFNTLHEELAGKDVYTPAVGSRIAGHNGNSVFALERVDHLYEQQERLELVA